MPDNPPNRRSIRLPGYDYSQPGAYFITLSGHPAFTSDFPFARVCEDQVAVTPIGSIIEREWLRTAELRPAVTNDSFIIMPTHMHGILILTDHPAARGAHGPASNDPVARHGPASGTIGAILAGFKAAVTSRVRRFTGLSEVEVWHRNYFEHVIRTESALARIREYIAANPARWALDRYNPARDGEDDLGQALWQLLKEQARE